MSNKFEPAFQSSHKQYISILEETSKLTNDLGPLLSKNCGSNKFLQTGIQFARIADQSSKSILAQLRDGHIAQAYVLLRWLLEHVHLLFYLWKNPNKFNEWLKNVRVQPKAVRGFLRSVGFSDWKKTYDDWCNVVHGNFIIADNYHVFWDRTPITDGQLIIVGNALLNLIVLLHKLNYFVGKILKELDVENFDEIIERFNELEEKITNLKNAQLNTQRGFIMAI